MSVVVTGGAGFIGSHICRWLVGSGSTVICVDQQPIRHATRISDLCSHLKFTYLTHDIRLRLPSVGPVSEIYHLVNTSASGIKGLNIYLSGTQQMLDLAQRHRASFLLGSSDEVYGEPRINPITERYYGNVDPIGQNSCVAEGRRLAETLTMEYHRKYQLDTKIARIFPVYGPGMNFSDTPLLGAQLYQSIHQKPIIITGSGIESRTYCYIDDLVQALGKLMAIKYHLPINLAGSEPITTQKLAKLIIKIGESTSNIKYVTSPAVGSTYSVAETSRARRILDWKPKTKLADGIKRTLASFST